MPSSLGKARRRAALLAAQQAQQAQQQQELEPRSQDARRGAKGGRPRLDAQEDFVEGFCQLLPRLSAGTITRGEAARLRETAEGFKAERVNLAKGQAERFTAILNEYVKSPVVTRQRLYLEAMEDIMPDITKIILEVEQGVLPILPLPGITPTPPALSVEEQQ